MLSTACGSSIAFGRGACCQKVHSSNHPSRPCILPQHMLLYDSSMCPSLGKNEVEIGLLQAC